MQIENPKISVLMSVYNGDKFINQTIDSILIQTEKDFEFIIINDGSTDNTEKIIKSYKDERIKYFFNNHKGLVNSLNKGLIVSNGRYIARIDADDISHPSRLKEQSDYLDKHKDTVICGTWAKKINENGEDIGIFNYPPEDHSAIKKYLIKHNPFIHSSVMFKKEVLKKTYNYIGFFKHVEDYELWTRILKLGIGHNIPKTLIYYRIHDNQITKRKSNIMKITGMLVRILAVFRYL